LNKKVYRIFIILLSITFVNTTNNEKMSYRIITDFANEKTCYYVPHESSTFQSLDELLQYTDGWSSKSTDEILGPDFGRVAGEEPTRGATRPDRGDLVLGAHFEDVDAFGVGRGLHYEDVDAFGVGRGAIRPDRGDAVMGAHFEDYGPYGVDRFGVGRSAVQDHAAILALRRQFPQARFDNPVETAGQSTTAATFGAYAPLFPAVCMATHFSTDAIANLKGIINEINEILLRRQDTVSFHFVPSECTWLCTHISRAEHCRFDLHVYRFPNHDEQRRGKHAVEAHRLEGDGWFFRSVYEDLRAGLDPTYDPPVPFADDEELVDPLDKASADLPSDLPPAPEKDGAQMTNDDAGSNDDVGSDPQAPSEEDFKKLVVDMLQLGSSSAQEEATQLVTAMYGSGRLGSPTGLDKACVRELVKIVCTSVTCVDWATQHAMITIAEVSKSPEYCEAIAEAQQEAVGEEDIFRRLFRLATMEATYRSQGMKRNSGDALAELLTRGCADVVARIGEAGVSQSEVARYVKGSLSRAWSQNKTESQEKALVALEKMKNDTTPATDNTANPRRSWAGWFVAKLPFF
jgi:hypothetical protein